MRFNKVLYSREMERFCKRVGELTVGNRPYFARGLNSFFVEVRPIASDLFEILSFELESSSRSKIFSSNRNCSRIVVCTGDDECVGSSRDPEFVSNILYICKATKVRFSSRKYLRVRFNINYRCSAYTQKVNVHYAVKNTRSITETCKSSKVQYAKKAILADTIYISKC